LLESEAEERWVIERIKKDYKKDGSLLIRGGGLEKSIEYKPYREKSSLRRRIVSRYPLELDSEIQLEL
jgi:hypothetical protein